MQVKDPRRSKGNESMDHRHKESKLVATYNSAAKVALFGIQSLFNHHMAVGTEVGSRYCVVLSGILKCALMKLYFKETRPLEERKNIKGTK